MHGVELARRCWRLRRAVLEWFAVAAVQMGNKGAFIRLPFSMKPEFVQFSAVVGSGWRYCRICRVGWEGGTPVAVELTCPDLVLLIPSHTLPSSACGMRRASRPCSASSALNEVVVPRHANTSTVASGVGLRYAYGDNVKASKGSVPDS